MYLKARYIVTVSAAIFLIVTTVFIGISIYLNKKNANPTYISAGIYFGLAAAPLPSCFFKPIRRYRVSLWMITALALCRAANILFPVGGSETRVAFYAVSFVIECLLLIEIPTEYFELPPIPTAEQMTNFLASRRKSSSSDPSSPASSFPSQSEYYHIDDPSLIIPTYDALDTSSSTFSSSTSAIRLNRKRASSSSSSSQRLLQRHGLEKRGRDGERGEVTRVEVMAVVSVILCSVLVVVLLFFQNKIDVPPPSNNSTVPIQSSEENYFDYTFAISLTIIGATSFFPFMLVPLEIMKVRKIVEDGAELVACNHSHGLAFLMVAGGFAIHFMICAMFTLADGLRFMEHKLSTGAASAMLGVDTITVVLPLGFHLFNVTKSASRTFVCSIVARTRAMSYVIVAALHVMMLAILLPTPSSSDCCESAFWASSECCKIRNSMNFVKANNTSLDPSPSDISCCELQSLSTAAAVIATIDFLILLSGSLSPILQLLYQSAMRQSVHNLHLHRMIAISGACFTILHIVLASQHTSSNASDLVHLVFGALSAFLFAVSGAGGFVISKFRYRLRPSLFRFLSSLHIPCTFLGMALLFMHQFRESKVLENHLFIAFILSCLICLILYSSFLIFNPLHSASLDASETEWGAKNSKYIFLVAHYQKPSPPGAYFLLYSDNDSHLNYFHARPIHVFSAKNRRLAFLVESSTENGRALLFSQHLANGKYPFC